MKLQFALSLVVILILSIPTDAAPSKGHTRPGEQKSKAHVKNVGANARKEGSRIVFPDTIILDIVDDAKQHNVKAVAKRVSATQSSITLQGSDDSKRKIQFENSAMYVGEDGVYMMTVEEEKHGKLKSRFIGSSKTGGRKSWIIDGTITSWDVKDPEGDWEQVLSLNASSQDQTGRKKRRTSIPTVFDYNTMNVIELIMMVDQQWLSWFKSRHATEAEALDEAALYMTLFLTEVNGIYRSVYDRSDGQFELVVYGVTMLYPAGNAEWPFLYPTSAGVLPATDSCGSNCLPLLDTLRTYLEYHWKTLPQFDHFAFLSGYDIASSSGTGLLGVAYVGTVCEIDIYRGYMVSVTEDKIYEAVSIFAHELGHALSANHDGSGSSSSCPTSGYIMAAYVVSPSATTEDSYWTFSTCAVNAFISHLTAMSNAGRHCLSPGATAATADDFRSQFCSGARGDEYSLDEQCSYEFSGAGFAFDASCNPLPTRLDGVTRMVPADACWDDNLVSCSSQSATGTCTGAFLFHVGDGTPCQGIDQTVDYVCFNGDCLPSVDICAGWGGTTSVVPTGHAPPCTCGGLSRTARRTCCKAQLIPPCCQECRTSRGVCSG